MLTPPRPIDEFRRLAALRALGILDTGPEERFDRLTRLAKRMFDVPIALVSLVDEKRQWFKSRVGLDATETPRDVSFCGHAILGQDVFVVPDALQDIRFADNPLVLGAPNMRFYAGCPLRSADGSRLGTLCLIDRRPRELDSSDLGALQDLATVAERELAATHLATTDAVTLLSNRSAFDSLAGHALEICRRHGTPASMLCFDLDGFKGINDRLGHAEGDRALKDFAAILSRTFRDSDVVGRRGGDEFAALLTRVVREDVQRCLARFDATLREHNRVGKRCYELAYSVGIAAFDPERHTEIDLLLKDADMKMYEQKRERKLVVPAAGSSEKAA